MCSIFCFRNSSSLKWKDPTIVYPRNRSCGSISSRRLAFKPKCATSKVTWRNRLTSNLKQNKKRLNHFQSTTAVGAKRMGATVQAAREKTPRKAEKQQICSPVRKSRSKRVKLDPSADEWRFRCSSRWWFTSHPFRFPFYDPHRSFCMLLCVSPLIRLFG